MSETHIIRNRLSFSLGSSSSRLSSSQTNPKLKKTFLQGKFEDNVQFFLYTLAYTLSIDSFTFMYKVGQYTTELNLVQYFMAYVFVGVPLYYMQMFLGQYTQVGMVHLRHMVPFGHGVIYTALITVFLYTIKYGMFFGDLCLYFLLAWQKHLPWMMCHNQEKNRMWGICFSDDTNNSASVDGSLNNRTYTSAYLYYVGTYLRITPNDTAYFTAELPTLHRTIGSVTAWALIFVFTVFICPRWPKLLFFLVYQFYILLTLLNMGTISTTGGLNGVRNFFKGTWEKIGSLMAWCRSISIVIQQLRLSHAFIILNASKLKPKSGNAGLLTVGFCTVSFISNLLCVVFFQSCVGMLVRKTNWSASNQINFGVEHDRGRFFVLIPQSLGYLTVPQIWSLQYFTCAISMILANQATHIHTLHSSLADVCPSAKKYQNYIILGYCIFSCLVSISVLGESNFIFSNYFEEIILALLEMINISYLSVLVFWIYGVRRLGDDICFTFGVQPTKFWQITWYLMPFITSCATYYEYNFHMSRTSTIFSKFAISVLVLICVCPIPILVFVEIFKHMKSRNLTGLFRPTYMWGPPDPEERHRRFSFNPRKETTYNSKISVCKHNCLLHSKTFKNLMEPEARCTQTYFQELSKNKLRR